MTRPAPWASRLLADDRIQPACAVLSFFVPFVVALAHVGSTSTWRDDVPLLRGLAWVGNERTGGLSAILVQASFFLPFGSVYFRAGFVAALALGGAGILVFCAARDVLTVNEDTPRLTAVLAAIAALTTTLSVTGQREGTVAGGSAVALMASFLVLRARRGEPLLHPPRGLLWGMLWGGLIAENDFVASALALAVGLDLVLAKAKVTPGAALAAAAGAAVTSALVLAPTYLRPLVRGNFIDVTGGFAGLGPAPFEALAEPLGGIGAWRAEIGPVALALAAAGGVLALSRSRLWRPGAAFVAIVLIDAAASFGEGKTFSSNNLVALHLLAMSALSVGVAIAVQTLTSTLFRWRLPLAGGAAVFLVMTNVTILAASAEDASFRVNRRACRGADAFIDEGLEKIPPHALLLVKSRATAARLWAARLASGARPDVLIVPVSAAGDQKLALGLLRAEPALQKVLRDIALEARPGEDGLTTLADARPLLVELDARWDRRVLSHLVPDRLWLRFAPEPRAASDRKAAFAALRASFARVMTTSIVVDRTDRSTAAVLYQRLADAATQAALLGDREEANLLLDQVGQLSDGDLFVAELRQRLSTSKSGPVDIKGLSR